MGTTPLQKLPSEVYPHLSLIISYLRHCQDITTILNEALARQLGLPENAFTSLQSPTKPSGTAIRFLRAFAGRSSEDLRTALIHHTDFGTLTLLANVVGGLQILEPGKPVTDESAWVWVRPQPGCLIVNIGDAMAQWTGGLLRSGMHRISYAPGLQRSVDKYSLVYLARAERTASMRRLINIDADDRKVEDEKLTAWEWEVNKTMGMVRAGYVPRNTAVES